MINKAKWTKEQNNKLDESIEEETLKDIEQNKIICPKCLNDETKINCYECVGKGYIDARGL